MSQESAKEKLNLLMLKEDEVLECILQCTTTTLKFNQLNSKCLLTFYRSLYVIYVFSIHICQVLSILKLSSIISLMHKFSYGMYGHQEGKSRMNIE